MAGNVSGLHIFQADTGPEPLSLLDNNYAALTTALNTLSNFSNNYVDSGSVNALIATVPAPQVFSYSDGVTIEVKAAFTNTSTTPTINVNALGTKTIVNSDGSALVPGQIVAATWSVLQYESSSGKFMLVGGGRDPIGTASSVSSTGNVTVGPPSSGTSLTVSGLSGTSACIINSGNSALAGTPDLTINRAGSTANNIADGPSIQLEDTTAVTASMLQHAGGQTEIHQFNSGAWVQILKILTTRGVVLNSPSSGTALSISGVAGANALTVISPSTASQSFGLSIDAGTNSSDYAANFANAGGVSIFQVRGDATVLGRGPVATTLVDMTPDKSSWTTTVSGPWSAGVNPTGTLKWERQGSQVTIWCDTAIQQTASSTAAITASALPAAITPSTSRQVLAMVTSNGSSVLANVIVNGSGTLTITPLAAPTTTVITPGTFSTGVCGIPATFSITYSL